MRVKPVDTAPPCGSLAITTTGKLPDWVGVPEITPVVGLMPTPVGKPVAVKLSGPPSGSTKAPAVVVLNATPTVPDCGLANGVPVSTGG